MESPVICVSLSVENNISHHGDKPKFRKPRPPPADHFKPRWIEPSTGYALTAGGIIFYDQEGLWLIAEKEKGKDNVVYTDIGGKYMFEDGDICATIRRELSEETYHSCEVTYAAISAMYESHQVSRVYINGHRDVPVYLCLLVPLDVAKRICESKLRLDPSYFDDRRRAVIAQNPAYVDHYLSLRLEHIPYHDLATIEKSYRLRQIIRVSDLSTHY